jgi:hypothetical protein
MQASLARWAVVTISTLGAIGCQGAKPSWWPGQKAPVYSQSSSTPPAGLQQYSQQQQYQQQQQQGYPQQSPAYMDQAAYGQNGAQNGYSTAGAYPIGNGNPQDAYSTTGAPTNGGTPYDQAYAQQQPGGSYPENYQTGGAAAGGYAGQPAGYSQGQGYPQPGGAGSYAAGTTAGYDQTRTADARYQQGGAGYGTNSPYDASGYNGGYSGQDPAMQPAGGAGSQQAAPQTDPAYQQPGSTGYQPGATSYQPGNTGYAPPGVQPYQSPAGPYNPDPNATSQVDPHYRPGSTGDYVQAGSAAATTAANNYNPAAAPSTASANTSRYPQTGAGATTDGSGQQPVDRYGYPLQDTSRGYGGTMQR